MTVFILRPIYLPGDYNVNVREIIAMTLGAGVQWHEAYDAAQAHGRVLVGGLASIGAAGGWLMGGGHTAIAPTYGLGKTFNISLNCVIMQRSRSRQCYRIEYRDFEREISHRQLSFTP